MLSHGQYLIPFEGYRIFPWADTSHFMGAPPVDSYCAQCCYDYRGSLCLLSLFSFLLDRWLEKQLLSDIITLC